MFAESPSNVNEVNIWDFLHSRKGEGNVYLENYLSSVYTILAEDAVDAKERIKKALLFAQNISGDEARVRDGLVSVLDVIDDDMIPLSKLI